MTRRRSPQNNENKSGSGKSQGRRPSSRKKTLSTASIILVLLAAFVFFVIITPKQPVSRATSTIGLTGEQGLAMPTDAYKGLVISEVMGLNSSAVPNDLGQYSDYIEVWNSTAAPINLYNVGLSDRTDKVLFLFPDITLNPDGRVVVYASGSSSTASPSSLHAKFKISSTKQEVISLFDPSQFIIHQVTLPMFNTNEVYSLTAEGTFEKSDYYSPGFPNGQEGHLAYLTSKTTAHGTLIINEIMADAVTGIADADGEHGDWVEIYNPTDQPQSLKDVYLSDDPAKPLKWKFPESDYIPAKGYYVVFCTGKSRIDQGTNIPHSNFKINAEGETIVISDGFGNVIDRVTFDNLPRDHSYGLNSFNEFELFQIPTPGLTNTLQSAIEMDVYMRSQNPTGVYITEALASNTQVSLYEEDKDFSDYVELYNPTNEIVSLSGYGLSDNLNRPRKWQFPEGAVIYPQERKVVYLDKTDTYDGNDYHTNFKISQHGGETLTFCDPTGNILDKLHLPVMPSNYSYGRSESPRGFFYYANPSPRAENGAGFNGFAANPSFSVQGGIYDQKVQVAIDVPDGTQVFYTTDGATPTTQSTLYEGQALTITHPTALRAKAFSSDPMIEGSDVITQTYIIGMSHSLPIVSIVIDPVKLWDPYTGMLASGVLNEDTMTLSEVPANAVIPFKNTVYRLTKGIWRTGHVEVYTLENEQLVSQKIKMTTQGDFSLDFPQKSIKMKATASEGSRYIDASLFEDRPFTQYKGFVVRTSGNDNAWTRLADGFQSRLIDLIDTQTLNQAWQPAAVYLNGEYWGHFNMRERIDRYFVAQHEGLPLEEADNMDLLQGSSSVKHGSNKEYRDMIKKVKTLSPGKNPEDLQYILDRIDVDNYFDYMAYEMFIGNSDPGNIRFYKLHGEGQKWKWIFYDMDYGLFDSAFNSPRSYLKEAGAGDKRIDNTLIRKLLENDEMKDKFLTRLGEIYQVLTTDTMISLLDEMKAILEPEMPVHFARWAEYVDKRISFDNPTTPEGALRYWNARIDRLKNVIKKRPTLFYDMVQEEFKLSDAQMLHYFGVQPPMPPDVT